MPEFTSYCEAVCSGKFNEKHLQYHNRVYGFPETDDNALFGRLLMEINQAGLSWDTVLNKEKASKRPMPISISPRSLRLRKKTSNAYFKTRGSYVCGRKLKRQFTTPISFGIAKRTGFFLQLVRYTTPQKEEVWVKIFKRKFKFTGKEITKEFLMELAI